MAGVVFEAGEFGPEIDCRAAALAVVGPHREIPGARVYIRADGELPTAADTRDVEVILAGSGQLAEIGGLARDRPESASSRGGGKRAAECDAAIARRAAR